jgi:3',5'-cyclic AMP phosphodiesterase CpdA
MAAAARILQISDLHLTPRRGRRAWLTDTWAGFDRVLRELPRLEPFERLIVTGDLANRSSLVTYRLLREALTPWLDRVRLLPGNHDGRFRLRQVFDDRLDATRAGFVDEVAGCRLIGLDSKRSFRVHGRLGDQQLRWLHGELRCDDRPALLFLHHPPVPVGTWWLDKDVVRDAARFAAAIRGTAARAVFCGHVHQDVAAQFAGLPFWACPSTGYQFAPGALRPGAVESREPALRAIDWFDDRLTTRVLRLGTNG